MKNPFQKLQSGVQALFNRVVNGESLAETVRKPAAIEALVAASAASFDGSADESYAKALGASLRLVRTKDLETLRQYNISVGLDPRLGAQNQDLAARDKPVLASFYSRGADGGTLALPDFKDGYVPYSAEDVLKNMAQRLRDGDAIPAGKTLYAGMETQAAVRTVITYVNWYVPERFPAVAVTKNPALKNPPAPRN